MADGITRRGFVKGAGAVVAGVAVAGPRALAQAGSPDTVFRGGRVLTMSGRRVARAVAVSGGRIAYVGSDAGVASMVGPATEVIDLRGRTLMPGIHDGTRTRWPAA